MSVSAALQGTMRNVRVEVQHGDAAFDRGMIVGMALACSEAISYGASARTVMMVLNAAGLDEADVIAAGIEEFDLDKLRPAFRLLERR